MRKHRDAKLVTTERWRNYLVSEPNFCRKFISYRNEKDSNINEWVYSFTFINTRSK